MPPPIDDETRYRLLKLLESTPELSQRDLAHAMGVSLGKVNYCLRAVMERGWVKVKNFTRNPNKRAYAYYLTPKGFEEKTQVTTRFLQMKLDEHMRILQEIERLRHEIKADGSDSSEVTRNKFAHMKPQVKR